jgi:hypothetical protein
LPGKIYNDNNMLYTGMSIASHTYDSTLSYAEGRDGRTRFIRHETDYPCGHDLYGASGLSGNFCEALADAQNVSALPQNKGYLQNQKSERREAEKIP